MAAALQDIFTLAQTVASALVQPPYYIRVPDFGTDPDLGRMLVRLIVTLGPAHPLNPNARLNFSKIVVDPAALLADSDGTRYSRTDQALSLHTDSTFLETPHELVAFHMATPDESGGESLMLPVDELAASLDADLQAALSRPLFPMGGALRPILSGLQDAPAIRYYRRQVDEDAARLGALATETLAALGRLDAALAEPARHHRFKLNAGEIVLINNRRALHGRTALSANSPRTMFRFRAYAGCLS